MFLILVFSILFLYCKIHCEKELFCVMTWHDLSRLSLIEVPNLWQFRDIDFVLTGQLSFLFCLCLCCLFVKVLQTVVGILICRKWVAFSQNLNFTCLVVCERWSKIRVNGRIFLKVWYCSIHVFSFFHRFGCKGQ